MKIQTRWIKHLKTDELKKEFLTKLAAADDVLSRIKTLIEEDIVTANKKSLAQEGYENPNWAFYQADLLGEMRAYNKVIRMIDTQEK
jgi:homoserine dehydrogenase